MEEYLDAQEEELFEHYRITVDKGQSPIRIDKFLSDKIADISRNKIQSAIEAELLKVNGNSVKSNYKVRPEDLIILSLPTEPRDTELVAQNIPLEIVYEDDELLVVNKPAGMVVHPGYNNWDGTLVNALVYHFQNLPTHRNGEGRPGLVHRIDKDTSGLLVIAKTDFAMAHLAKQFFDHSIERSYNALVWGALREDEGTVDAHVGRSLKDRRITDVFPDGEYGKNAITHYKLLENFLYTSLIECRLETGRTHQIRAHMKYLGYPLFSDELYGGTRIVKGPGFSKYKAFVENCFKIMPRQALHAKSLGFIHPKTKEKMYFEAPLPEDFSAVIEKWSSYASRAGEDI